MTFLAFLENHKQIKKNKNITIRYRPEYAYDLNHIQTWSQDKIKCCTQI